MKTPAQTEGDVNSSPRRQAWARANVSDSMRDILQRDADAFMHQSVSSPCLSVIKKAEGIFIEDMDGRRFMDFHGNNVHHIGYGHPRLKAAIAKQMDQLSFAPAVSPARRPSNWPRNWRPSRPVIWARCCSRRAARTRWKSP